MDKIQQESFNEFKVNSMKKDLQNLLNKQKLNAFLERTHKRNKEQSISQRKNDATRQVLKHTDQMIKASTSGELVSFDQLYDFGKYKSNVPLDSFLSYYIYKTEETENTKKLLRKQQKEKENGGFVADEDDQKEDDRVVLNPTAVFSNFISDNYFSKSDMYISEEQYCQLSFINQVPEVVCDVLCYLAKYYHYRTTEFSHENYRTLMDA